MKTFFSTFKKIFLYIIAILLACEAAACFHYFVYDVQYDTVHFPYTVRAATIEDTMSLARQNHLGHLFGEQYNKKPIVVFGSSAISNSTIPLNSRFCAYLSNYLKTPVYDMGSDNFFLKNIYYMLSDESFFSESVPQEPSAVILVFEHGFFDVYFSTLYNGILYRNTPHGLEMFPECIRFLNKSFFFMRVKGRWSWRRSRNFPVAFNDILPYFIGIKQKISEHWKNTKIIIVKYIDNGIPDNPEKWKEIEDLGYTVLEGKDVLGKDFLSNSDFQLSASDQHPSVSVWEKLVPYIAQKGQLE